MTGTVPTQDEAQSRRLMAEQVTAMRARDAGRLVSRYPPEIVSFGLAPPLRRDALDLQP